MRIRKYFSADARRAACTGDEPAGSRGESPDGSDDGSHEVDSRAGAPGGEAGGSETGRAEARPRKISVLSMALLGLLGIGLLCSLLPLMARVRASTSASKPRPPLAPQDNDARPSAESRLGARQEVLLGDAPVRGSRNAAVTIVEFADYQCPYCQQMHPELKVLQEELAGKVAVAFKDFPLAMHENAEKAAEAARCAGEQGKYWDYHDVLFQNSERLEVPQLKQYAHDLKLNQANFDTCLDSGKEAAAIQKDVAQGRQLGVKGTPSFFFNGRLFAGAVDYYTLRGIVEALLKTDAPASASSAAAPPPQQK